MNKLIKHIEQAPQQPLLFFDFRQNNSGGRFEGPAIYVIVEARNAEEANKRAQSVDVYFDGCSKGMDCSCCGDRWYEKWKDNGGDKEPSIYGEPISKKIEDEEFAKDASRGISRRSAMEQNIPYILILHYDGTKTKYYHHQPKKELPSG